jgi:hypothetical protein
LDSSIRNGFGTLTTPELKYEGPWLNDKMGDGPGELTTGTISYKGGFVGGLFHGNACLVTPEYTYDGNFIEGVKEGSG